MNMIKFLIKGIELNSIEVFKVLIENYEKSFLRDPSFKIVFFFVFIMKIKF